MANKQLKSVRFTDEHGVLSNDIYYVPQNAAEFDAQTAYAIGDYVSNAGKLYKFKAAHAAGAWNSAEVDEVTVGGELENVATALSGKEASANKVTAWSGTVSDTNYPSEKLVKDTIDALDAGDFAYSSSETYTSNTVGDELQSQSRRIDQVTNESKTVTGNPIEIMDGVEGMPVKDLQIAFAPKQALHGYSNPWPAGCGKNKFKTTLTSQTYEGIVFTVYDDGTFRTVGTQETTNKPSNVGSVVLPAGTYVLSGCPTGGAESTYRFRLATGSYDGTSLGPDYGSGMTFTLAEETQVYLRVYIQPAAGAVDFVWKPMIRLATETDATFAPYENICPITGWDSLNVSRCGKNLFNGARIDGYISDDGTVGTDSWSYHSDYIPLTAGESYVYSLTSTTPNNNTVNRRIHAYDSNKNWLEMISKNSSTGMGQKVYPFVMPSGAAFIRVQFRGAGVGAAQADKDIQIEAGNSATTYDNRTELFTIPFQTTQYGGTIDVLRGKAVIDYYSEELSDTKVTTAMLYKEGFASTYYNGLAYANTGTNNLLCSHLYPHAVYSIAESGIYCYESDNKSLGIRIPYSAIDGYDDPGDISTSIDAVKKYLTDNTVRVAYKLSTPIEIDLTSAELSLLAGYNYIYSNSNDDITMEYGEAIASLDEKINDLNAGNIAYDDAKTYSSGTVGEKLKNYSDMLDCLSNESKIITGNPIEITDGVDGLPVKSLQIAFLPKQAGTGDPTPENVRAITGWDSVFVRRTGINLLRQYVSGSSSYVGLTFNFLSDGKIRVYGTSTNTSATQQWASNYTTLLAGSYRYSDGVSVSNNVYGRLLDSDNNVLISGAGLFTLTKTTSVRLRLYIKANSSNVDLTFAPMIRVENQPNEYSVYKEQLRTIPFATTQYGGTIDILKGKGYITHYVIDGGDITWTKVSNNNYRSFYYLPNPVPKYDAKVFTVISSNYKGVSLNKGALPDTDYYVWIRQDGNDYQLVVKDTSKSSLTAAEFKTAVTGVTFVYELATPVEIAFTPAELSLLAGYNYIYSDSNDSVTIEYGEGIASLDEKINRAVANIAENTFLSINVPSVTSLPMTVNDYRITDKHFVVSSTITPIANLRSNMTVTTANGSITLTGTVVGDGIAVSLILGKTA